MSSEILVIWCLKCFDLSISSCAPSILRFITSSESRPRTINLFLNSSTEGGEIKTLSVSDNGSLSEVLLANQSLIIF